MEPTQKVQSTISEIREITGNAVAKKQDAAKLNFPKIIEKIRFAAERGESEIYLSERECNEYDKELLTKEGFSVWYTTMPKYQWANDYDYLKQQYLDGKGQKGWKISW